MSKKITFEDHQVVLLQEMCGLVLDRLDNEGVVTSNSHKMAGRFTYKCILELRDLLEHA